MFPNSELPPQIVANDLLATSEMNSENLRNSVELVNSTSSEYRKTLSLIDEKIIFLSAGSISLLLTFLGLLFGSTRNLSSLHFIYIFISVIAFLITISLLLAARWLWALYLTRVTHGFYLENLKAKRETEVRLMRSGAQFINNVDYSNMTPDELGTSASNMEKYIKKLEKEIKSSKSMENKIMTRAKALAIFAYVFMLLAYVSTTIFFCWSSSNPQP